MPCKCCVPLCRGNYTPDTKVRVFSFPKDEELRKAWIRAIPRQNFVPSKSSRVCALHFKYDDIVRETSYVDGATGRTLSVPLPVHRLRPRAIPSRFPDCPPSPPSKTGKTTAKRPSSSRRKQYNAAATPRALAESTDDTDKIFSLKDLAELVRGQQSAFWHIIENSERLILLHIVEREAPWIKCSIVIKSDLALSLYFVKTPVSKFGSDLCVPAFAESKKSVIKLLESIEKWGGDTISSSESQDDDICETICVLLGRLSAARTEDHAIQFLSEQLKLLSTKKRQKNYSADFIVFCSILFMISPHAYKYLCSYGSITLPHPMIIRSVCSSHGMKPQERNQTETSLCIMVAGIGGLDYQERFVALMVEKIHVKPYFEYKGGNTTGVRHGATEVADSALVFRVQSLTCQFKQVAHIVPVQDYDAHFLHQLLRDVICGLEKIGYRIACVVSDNSPVNRMAMSYFASPPSSAIVYPHPADSARPLFSVVDPLHLLKCICNDWLDQKDEKVCFNFPEFESKTTEERPMLSASFASIKDAYSKLVCEQSSKYSYTLSKKSLCPSYTERQSLQLALEVFNHSLLQVLRAFPTSHGCDETASFIEIIVKWWKIVNVKSPYSGNGPRDQFQEALFPSAEDPRVDFLYNVLDWLDAWKSKNLESGTLSEDTHAALQQTTHAFLEIGRYCFSEVKLPCVLLGKIQTDNLEERFGRLEKPGGSSYHASIRQLYEGQNELSQDTLPTVAPDSGTGNARDEQWEGLEKPADIPHPSCNLVVTEEVLSKIEDVIPVLVYVAAYAVHATLKRLDCTKCRPALTTQKTVKLSVAPEHHELVKDLHQGGLLFPTMFALNAVAHSYIVAEQLSKQPEFLDLPNQRHLVTNLTVELLINEEFHDFDACEDGHTSEHVLKHVLWCSTSIWLEKFCRSVSRKHTDGEGAETGAQNEDALEGQAEIDDSMEYHPGYFSKKKAKPIIKLKKLYRMNCEHCEFFSLRHGYLTSHYITSHPEHPLSTCDACPDRFAHQAYMLVHKTQAHCELEEECQSLPCGLCEASLEGRGALVEHLLQAHAPASTYGCPECSENFATAADLLSHRNAAHNPKSRECPHCPKKFKTPWYCRQHIIRSHRNSRLLNSCRHCSRRYHNVLTLRYHMALSHMHELTDEEKVMLEPLRKHCTQCDYTTFNRRSLERHIRRNHGSRLQCDQCSSQFSHGWELTRHQRMKHSSVGEQQCPHCPRVLVCPKMYAEHVRMHQDGQGHECTICKRLFGSEAVLEYHVTSHTNASEIGYEVCSHTFGTQQELANHKKKHTMTLSRGTMVRERRESGEWKFSCDKCLFRFKFESSLSAHKMSAHKNRPKGGKPFTCQICSRSFRTMFNLSSHIRTHTGERPFQCEECGARFSQKNTLRDHKVVKHSRAFRHKCPLCSKGCISKYLLKKHLQAVHQAQLACARSAAPSRQPTSNEMTLPMAAEPSAIPSIVSVHSIPSFESLEKVCASPEPSVLEQVKQEGLPQTAQVSIKVEETDLEVAENCTVAAEWAVPASAVPGYELIYPPQIGQHEQRLPSMHNLTSPQEPV